MWAVRDLATRTVELDFSLSGLASCAVTQIVIDGSVFANAAELSSWDDDTGVQVHICEVCGSEGCASGGWLVARNVGVGVAFVPAFGGKLGGDWELVQFGPPYFSQGMPVFEPDDYARLRRWCGGLPAIEAVPVLTSGELLRCLQWEAPARALGKFPPEIQIDQDLLLAASDGEVSDAAAMLESAIRRIDHASGVSLIPSPSTARALTLCLDAPGTPEWTPLYTIDEQVRLAAPLPSYLVGSN